MKKWENNIRRTVPYVPGEQPKEENIIKLNTNENPYPPVRGALSAHLRLEFEKMRLYPDPEARELVEALEKYYGLGGGQVAVGTGSDDILSLCFLTFFNSDRPILFPDVTYSFYPVWAQVYRIPYECPPLDENFCIRPEDYMRENGGIVIANPNAPTSLGMKRSEIEEIVRANPDVVVIVDEAYVDFGGETALPLLEKYDNLLIVRTYSKSRSLAGIRIGFAMGNRELIQFLRDVQASINSYSLTREAIRVGAVVLEDEETFQKNRSAVMDTREWSRGELEKRGFQVMDSQTNFLFAKHGSVPGQKLFEELKRKGIYVRHFDSERIRDYLRITVGTGEQMEQLIRALDELLI